MIKMSNVVFETTEDSRSQDIILHARSTLSAHMFLEKRKMQDPGTVREAQKALCANIWSEAYGEVRQEIAELKALVLPALVDYAQNEKARQAFQKLAKMLEVS